jgi:hypothetical protein
MGMGVGGWGIPWAGEMLGGCGCETVVVERKGERWAEMEKARSS